MPDRSEREAALTHDDLGQFADAVVAAFPDKQQLFAILLSKWGVRVADIVYIEKAGGLVVADLVEWSHAQGRALDMLELVWGEVQSQVAPMQTLAGRLLESDVVSQPTPAFDKSTPFESIPGAPQEAVAQADLDAVALNLLARMRSGLCVVAGDQRRASGFLVGKRHVLTSFSAISDLVGSDGSGLRLLFDAGPDFDPLPVAVKKGKGWLAAYRDHGDLGNLTDEEEARELDFALLRLDKDAPADHHVLPLPSAVPIAMPGEPVFLLQFADARELMASPGTLIKYSGEGTRVHYDANSTIGSAGAPVVTRTGDLIAMHHARIDSAAGELTLPQGIPVWRIRASIAEAGIDPENL